jgi:hypothetical protein
VALIELLRDAWIAIYQENPARAQYITQGWLAQSYPTFRRLALFAATHESITPGGEWVDWLQDGEDWWWLWSAETRRETMRLLVQQGSYLSEVARAKLETGILAGPPRGMFRYDIEPERWQDLADYMIWLRLAKLSFISSPLGYYAQNKFSSLSSAHPEWRLADDESDEFSYWMTGTGDPDYEERQETEMVPRNRRELVTWLKRERPKDVFYEDNWRATCGERFFVSSSALRDLAREYQWPAEYWREALQAWSDEKLLHRSWHYVAPLLQLMPDEVLQDIASSVAWWLKAVAQTLDRHEITFFYLCERILEMQHQDENDTNTDQPVTRAINHPVGYITQALLHFWFRREPDDNEGMPDDLKPLFSMLVDTKVEQYLHARILLASRLIPLFRVDRKWTEAFLLPLFNWQASVIEARAAWDGFLWSPRLYYPLLAAFKVSLLDTAYRKRSINHI